MQLVDSGHTHTHTHTHKLSTVITPHAHAHRTLIIRGETKQKLPVNMTVYTPMYTLRMAVYNTSQCAIFEIAQWNLCNFAN